MSRLPPIFEAGYRIFFCSAGVFAALALAIWEMWLIGLDIGEATSFVPNIWHGHELIFGYGSMAVAGFLLTAAPNWTGKAVGGKRFFLGLFMAWFAGRLAILFSGHLPAVLVTILDLSFLPVLLAKIFLMLIKRPKGPQMILLGVLLIFWLSNVTVHIGWLTDNVALQGDGLKAGIYSLAALVIILGGRVTPAFTRNAMAQAGKTDGFPDNPVKLAVLSIALGLMVPIAILLQLPDSLIAVPAIAAGMVALLRLSNWRGGWTASQPILWTLHLSYFANGAGLILFGLGLLNFGPLMGALHISAIGGVGGMTVSVMSRAALGHSGRELVASQPLAIAYALIPAAALVRYAASLSASFHFSALLVSGALWIVAFSLFTLALWPVFTGQPTDGAEERSVP